MLPGASARAHAPRPLGAPPAGGRLQSPVWLCLHPTLLCPQQPHGGICVHFAVRTGPGSKQHPISSPGLYLTEIQKWFLKFPWERRPCLCPDSSSERGSSLLTARCPCCRSHHHGPYRRHHGPPAAAKPSAFLKLRQRTEDPSSSLARGLFTHTHTCALLCL